VTRRITDLEGNDPYTLLQVSPEATVDDIQRAYRRVMREAHPDMATGDEDRTKLLNIARDVLLDHDLRAEYDRRVLGGAPEPETEPVSAWDAEDIVVDDPPTVPYQRPAHNPYSQPVHQQPAYQQPTYPMSGYTPPPVYRPAPSSGVGLGVWALVAAALCSPLGAVLGVVALMQSPRPEGANKVCAIIAVCWGGVGLLCCVGYLVFGILGSSLSTFSGT
jgi:hypothetical protein